MMRMIEDIGIAIRQLFIGPIQNRTWLSIGYLDIIQSYRRSFFGPLWVTLSIGIQAVSVTFIYSQLFNAQNTKEYYSYVVCGLISWAWFSALLTDMGNVFLANGGYIKTTTIGKNQFIWSMAWKHTIIFLHNLILWIIYILVGGVSLSFNTLFIFITFPIVFFISIPIIGMFGILFSRYRDFSRLISSLITLLLIITPIFWMSSQLTGNRQLMYKMNPFYYLVESLRQPLMGNPVSEHTWLGLFILFFISWIVFAVFYIRKSPKLIFWI